jgi:hypothetical protein
MEPFLILVVLDLARKSRGVETRSQQPPKMIKSFVASLIVVLLGTVVIATPGSMKVAARETAVLVKGDRLHVQPVDASCSAEIWPDLPAHCLQSSSGQPIQQARLVHTSR